MNGCHRRRVRHSLAVTQNGQFFSWGWSTVLCSFLFPLVLFPSQTTPVLLESRELEQETVVSIGAGARHSVAVTHSGQLFSWGWNKFGQLGLGDTEDRLTPTRVNFGSIETLWEAPSEQRQMGRPPGVPGKVPTTALQGRSHIQRGTNTTSKNHHRSHRNVNRGSGSTNSGGGSRGSGEVGCSSAACLKGGDMLVEEALCGAWHSTILASCNSSL